MVIDIVMGDAYYIVYTVRGNASEWRKNSKKQTSCGFGAKGKEKNY